MCPGRDLCHKATWQHYDQEPHKLAKQAWASGRPWGTWLQWGARNAVEGQWTQNPPQFKGSQIRLEDVADFVGKLLSSNPFGTHHNSNVPWVDFNGPEEGKVAAITQRQLAFIVANSLMGNTIPAQDGLAAALRRCSSKEPAPTGYLYSLLSFLAILRHELSDGSQGKTLIGATPGAKTDKWKNMLKVHQMSEPTLCTQEAGGESCGLKDFMAGGTDFQAVTDIAGDVVGGGAELCNLACSQDESLVQFYSETLAFAFFAGNGGRLPVPWTLLGARRYLRDLSGQSGQGAPYYSMCGHIPGSNWLNEDIPTAHVEVPLDKNLNEKVPSSSFVAVASKCAACNGCKVEEAVQNMCWAQRHQLDDDVTLWYQAYEPTMYNDWVQSAFRKVVRRIGTGPWGAGVWYGDSQQYFLTTWLATSLLGRNDVTLDYYVYSNFCENPGNQCYVLGGSGCRACIANASGNPYMVPQERCGVQGVQDMVWRFQGVSAKSLYNQISSEVSDVKSQVFDILGRLEQPPKAHGKGIEKPEPPKTLGIIGSERWSMNVDAGASPIKIRHGLCLDAPEPTKNGGIVHTWTCYKGLANQQWVYDHETEQIRNAHGICLDTSEPHKKGGEVHMWQCDHHNLHQRWVMHGETGNIKNRHGHCLDAEAPHKNGGKIHLWPCGHKNWHQQWLHHDTGGKILLEDARGLCLDVSKDHDKDYLVRMKKCIPSRIQNQLWEYDKDAGQLAHGNQCLIAQEPAKSGSKVALSVCNHTDKHQQWDYDARAGLLKIRHGLCLDEPEPDDKDDGIHLWWCFSSLKRQQWVHQDRAGMIRNRHGFCLDAPEPYVAGSIVHMWRCDKNSGNQHWHLDKLTGLIKTKYGSCLDSPTPSKNGGKLQIAECDSEREEQQWSYDDESGQIRHPHGLCIDTPEERKNGGTVHLWRCNEELDAQQWI